MTLPSLEPMAVGAKPEAKRDRFSILRFVFIGVALGVCGLAGSVVWSAASNSFVTSAEIPFAAYVDVTLTPVEHFEDPIENPNDRSMLGFIVADPSEQCQPSWGTYYSLDAAGRALDLDRRILRYAERSGSIGISFGGQANTELAVACTDEASLLEAYRSVYDRYAPAVLDFDIEGDALGNVAANTRRASALAQLQSETGVAIWLTIPVAGHGLLDSGVAVIDGLLDAGVEISIVNVMTMNFAESRNPGETMGEVAARSLEATRLQLEDAYTRARVAIPEEGLWAHIGATVMIGQNDVASDRFELSDAQHLVDFAGEVGLGQLAMWSLNRDAPCGEGTASGALSNSCSGVDQAEGEFALALSAAVGAESDSSDDDLPALEVLVLDDASRSPYPIWRSSRSYAQGAKVVWQGRVYEAKWWSDSLVPGASVANVWDTPWRYLGPVTAADVEAIQRLELAGDNVWALWRSEEIYLEGDEVEHEGEVFRAEWWTQGDLPDADPEQPYDHPWILVGHFVRADRAGDAGDDEDERVFIGLDS